MLRLVSTSKDAWVGFHKQGCLGWFPQARMLVILCVCVREAEGGETTPSFALNSNQFFSFQKYSFQNQKEKIKTKFSK